MLRVKTPQEAAEIIGSLYAQKKVKTQRLEAVNALGRVLSDDIIADEHVPSFDRSTVDGYAVIASDTFGCSESMPAVLSLSGEILMGEAAHGTIISGTCVAVSTGGDLPEGANAVVMVEHTEDYGDGLIGILRPAAPGNSIIFKGDDVSPGDIVLSAGTVISPHDIGILSAIGSCEISVRQKPIVGVISTGDELVEPGEKPGRGQVRDVNTPMLMALCEKHGASAVNYGIISDEAKALSDCVMRAVSECDVVLISGGSSAGVRDMTAHVIKSNGELLFHGIAMKPGKPTIFGVIDNKPVYGLPGHPVAAYFVTELFVRPLITGLTGAFVTHRTANAKISEAISSNHGRAEYIAVKADESGTLHPIRGKSGLIASLAHTDGYICIPRDSEGIPAGADVEITYW